MCLFGMGGGLRLFLHLKCPALARQPQPREEHFGNYPATILPEMGSPWAILSGCAFGVVPVARPLTK